MIYSLDFRNGELLLVCTSSLYIYPRRYSVQTQECSLNLFHHHKSWCFPKPDLTLLQICGAGNVFWFSPSVRPQCRAALSIFPACCSHASFWTKYIFRAIMKSKLHALLSPWTYCSQSFYYGAATQGLYFSVSARLNESLFILVNCTLKHE